MNTETLILAGDGYNIQIAPEALARRDELLDAACTVKAVTSNDESADAAFHMRRLAQLRIEVDKSRKEIKEPVIRIGKLIDETAKQYLADVDFHETRIKKLIGDHATEVARLKAEKEAEERRAFEAARQAREAAEAAATAADASGKLRDIIAAKHAETARMEALDARMTASEEVATTKIAQGVRFAWDFEVMDMDTLYAEQPNLVELTYRRREILAWLSAIEAEKDRDPVKLAAACGIHAYKKPVVSTK